MKLHKSSVVGLCRLCADCRGAAFVEFGMIAPVLFMLIIGGIEFGRVYWTRHTLQFAAEQAGRYAMVHVSASTTEIADVARANLPGLDPASAAVTVVEDSSGSTNYVTVTVSFDLDFHIPFVDLGSLVLTGMTRVPLLS
jgi:Flp pilus assembly protein TadG